MDEHVRRLDRFGVTSLQRFVWGERPSYLTPSFSAACCGLEGWTPPVEPSAAQQLGTDPVQACRECRTRLYDMHVKDLAVSTDERSETEVGRGVVDIPALFRTLLEIGYSGQVGLEYEINARNPLPGMIESLAHMRGVLAAVAPSRLTTR